MMVVVTNQRRAATDCSSCWRKPDWEPVGLVEREMQVLQMRQVLSMRRESSEQSITKARDIRMRLDEGEA